MIYIHDFSEKLDKKLKKLTRKNKNQLEIIHKKIQQILINPYHFKPLRGNRHGTRRVHIDNHFVLTYEIDEKNKVIMLLDYDHHDKIY